MVAKAIEDCFTENVLKFRATTEMMRVHKNKRDARLSFAESDLLKVWCDCSFNFEYNRLRKLIINFNKEKTYDR